MEPRFTVLLPVIRVPAMLPFAIDTVLAQSLPDFELFIIGDGAPDETIACAQGYAARDPRVKVFPLPKGAGVGEGHRHVALGQARGRYVAHISDDDLWFPNHLQEMEKLLLKVDFGHVLHVYVNCDDTFLVLPANLASPTFRQRMLNEVYNAVGDTVAGYRMDAYRRLPEGWAPATTLRNPDLMMWRKFLRRDDMTFDTRMAVTALIFDSAKRPHMTLEDRTREVRRWHARIQDAGQREEIVQEVWRSLVLDLLQREADYRAAPATPALYRQIEALRDMLDNRASIDRPIDFSARGRSYLYTGPGWSVPERDLRWTDGKEAVLRVRPEASEAGDPYQGCVMRLRARAHGSQRVRILVDGKSVADLRVDGDWCDYDVDVTFADSGRPAESTITLQLPDAHSPKSVGVSDDARELGIALASLTLLYSEKFGRRP